MTVRFALTCSGLPAVVSNASKDDLADWHAEKVPVLQRYTITAPLFPSQSLGFCVSSPHMLCQTAEDEGEELAGEAGVSYSLLADNAPSGDRGKL